MVITPSIYTKDLVHKYYGLRESKVQAIQLAIDKTAFQYEEKVHDRSPYILYVGRINEMKNISQIINSYLIARNSIDIDLIIVGDDKIKFYNMLEETKCDADTKSRIKFYQNVSEVEKNKLMKNAELFLYPTLFEGFGFPPLEAMSNSCPVIVSKNSSFPEVCANAAYYVDPKDDNEIANGIIEVLTNNVLKSELIKRGLERVQLFSWRETALEHLNVLKSILCEPNIVRYTKPTIQKSFVLKEGKY